MLITNEESKGMLPITVPSYQDTRVWPNLPKATSTAQASAQRVVATTCQDYRVI